MALIVLCAGCGHKPLINKLDRDSVVLTFGDSLTFGTGAATEESYPTVLAEIIGYQVINKGEPGELTAEGVGRLPHILERTKPNLVILCHGGNDMLRKRPQEVTVKNLDSMIGMIRHAGADVIIIGVPQPNLILRTPEFYTELADKYCLPIDTKTLAKILSKRDLKSDRIHPNAAGYKILAKAVADLIEKSGGKRPQ